MSIKEYVELLKILGYSVSTCAIRHSVASGNGKVKNYGFEDGKYIIEIDDKIYHNLKGNITFCPNCVKLNTQLETIKGVVLQ